MNIVSKSSPFELLRWDSAGSILLFLGRWGGGVLLDSPGTKEAPHRWLVLPWRCLWESNKTSGNALHLLGAGGLGSPCGPNVAAPSYFPAHQAMPARGSNSLDM